MHSPRQPSERTAGGPASPGDSDDLGAKIVGIANLTDSVASVQRTNPELELANAIVHRAPPSWRHDARDQISDARRGFARSYGRTCGDWRSSSRNRRNSSGSGVR